MDCAITPPRTSGACPAGLAAVGAAAATGVLIPVALSLFAGPDPDIGGALLGSPGQVLFGLVMLWMFACLIALAHAVVAVPLYFFLRAREWVNWSTSALAGALIGGLPIPLLLLFPLQQPFARVMFAVQESPDVWPLPEDAWGALLLLFGVFALPGLVGGLVFRAVLGRQT